MLFRSFLLAAASTARAAVIRRGDPGFQEIPSSAQADNTFNNGAPLLAAEPPMETTQPVPAVYGSRSIDLPFGRLYHGKMKFFGKGQLNTPDGITDKWIGQPNVVDSAKQSACGIPDNAFSISKVAIHPYFLKFAPLDRYCMQDVCISFWNGKTGSASSDMILKVTDVCTTDPNDPTHCATPGDIKIDRTKAQIMEHLTDKPLDQYPQLMGDEFTDGDTYWFFAKCWADALVQPAYKDNWFAKPALPNNLKWSQDTATEQWRNNNASYPLHDPPWPVYDNNAYNPEYDDKTSPPIPDWAPGDPEPEWCPVAGGRGFGNPTGKQCGGPQQVEPAASGSSSTVVESSGSVASATSKTPSTFGSLSITTSPTSAAVAFTTSGAAASLSSTSRFTAIISTAPAYSSSSTSATSTTIPATSPVITAISSTTGWSNSTSGVNSGMNGMGQVSPKQGGQQVGESGVDAEDDTCDVEPEGPAKGQQQIVDASVADDECEW